MKRKFPGMFLFFPASLIMLFFVSCGPAVLVETATPTPTITFEASATPILDTATPCIGLCPEDSMTATAAMGATFAAISTNTPPPWATIIPAPGDLGWGSIHGSIGDGATGLPIEGATVTCEHISSVSPYLCNGVTTTDSEGMYAFTDVFFHETDRIALLVEARGYAPLHFEIKQALIPPADFETHLGLLPLTAGTETPTPLIVMCTAVACEDGVLVCGATNGCPAGCGAVCIPHTPTP